MCTNVGVLVRQAVLLHVLCPYFKGLAICSLSSGHNKSSPYHWNENIHRNFMAVS
jgi:hypothetical protein